MNTPLLASDEPNMVPSLGGAVDLDSNSHLTRMLREAPSSPSVNEPLIPRVSVSSTRIVSSRQRPLTTISFITIITGSLVLIQTGLWWGAFLSPSWISTHMIVQHWLSPTPLDSVLQVLDLGTIINAFVSTDHFPRVLFLAVTTVILPCCAMIAQPMAILERHSAVLTGQAYTPKSNHWIRLAFAVVFTILLVDTCVAAVQLELVESKLLVRNEFGSGMWAYLTACCMTVVVAMLLRISNVKNRFMTMTTTTTSSTIEMENGFMRILEEEEVGEDVVDGNMEGDVDPPDLQEHRTVASWWSYRLFKFESCVLAMIFGIAALCFPLFSVSYHGVAADWMSQTVLQVSLYDLIGKTTQSDLAPLVFLQLLILPALAFLLAIMTCFGLLQKKWLSAIHVGVNGLSMCVALLLIIPVLHSVGDFILQQQSICSSIQVFTGEPCLTLLGTIDYGTWFFLMHVLSLELFVGLTLRA